MIFHRIWPELVVGALLLGVVESAHAQEIAWQTDYNAARQEARAKSRPLLLYFTTVDCFWCRKLEASTFRDPTVVSVIQQRFVCLKVDGQREDLLAQALAIRSFPTLVLAGSDGKLSGTYIGHQEVPRFHEILLKVLAHQSNPEWMVRAYQEAAEAVAAANYLRALPLLREILEDGQNRPIQDQAAEMLRDVEKQTAGQTMPTPAQPAPPPTLLEIKPLSPSLAEPGRVLASITAKPNLEAVGRPQRAQELLEQARQDYQARNYLGCLDCCRLLRDRYADLPACSQSDLLAAEIRKHPQCLEQACAGLGDRLGALYLDLAESWMRQGYGRQAAESLERVVQLAPRSQQADRARTQLTRLKSGSTVQVETSLKVSP